MKNTIEKLTRIVTLLEDGAMYHRYTIDLENEYFPRASNPKEASNENQMTQREYSEMEEWLESFIYRLEDFLESMCVNEEE